MIIETDRLISRPLVKDDLEALIVSRLDPEVYKYLGGTELQNPAAITKRMDFYMDCYEKFGFAMFALIWKENNEFIGTAGLQPLGDTGEIEVGYSMKRPYWGKGIGTEIAGAWLEHGFGSIALERIVAVAVPENAASINIMKKLGMIYEKTEDHYGTMCVFYAADKKMFDEAAAGRTFIKR